MSHVVYDYKCDGCNLYFYDEFVRRSEANALPCPTCGENMRILPAASKVDWNSLAMGASASPEAIRHWEKKHRQQKAKEEKSMREHGDRGKSPGA